MKVSRAALVRSERERRRVSKRAAPFLSPVRRTCNQVRQERLQGSIPPAAAHRQQRRDPGGRQSQAAHRLRRSERWRLTRLAETPSVFFSRLTGASSCRCLGQLAQRRPVCPARARRRQQTEGENQPPCFRLNPSARSRGSDGPPVRSQGDVILQSDHVIETLTKIAICADKINSININQGR